MRMISIEAGILTGKSQPVRVQREKEGSIREEIFSSGGSVFIKHQRTQGREVGSILNTPCRLMTNPTATSLISSPTPAPGSTATTVGAYRTRIKRFSVCRDLCYETRGSRQKSLEECSLHSGSEGVHEWGCVWVHWSDFRTTPIIRISVAMVSRVIPTAAGGRHVRICVRWCVRASLAYKPLLLTFMLICQAASYQSKDHSTREAVTACWISSRIAPKIRKTNVTRNDRRERDRTRSQR